VPAQDVHHALETAGLKARVATADGDKVIARPMLHINEKLGYRRIPGWLTFINEA